MSPRIISKRTGIRQSGPVDSKTSLLHYSGENGQTVLTLLQKVATTETIPHHKEIYVTSINGICGNSGAGWIFRINGKLIPKPADSVKTVRHDKIVWRLAHQNQGDFTP